MTNDKKIKKIYDFLRVSEQLKKTKRWKDTPTMAFKETSADHSWHLAILLLVLSSEFDYKVDILKALKIALVHDLVEAIADDTDASLIYLGKKTKEEKFNEEFAAIKQIKEMLPDKSGRELHDLWVEYEEAKTPESKLVKALDKIEGINHVLCETYRCFDIPELIAPYPNKAVSKFKKLKPILSELHERLKPEFAKKGWEWKKEYEID